MTTPRRNRVDLHTHTTRSDGVWPPLELFGAMRAYGMRLVAITDHDSVDAYRDLAAAAPATGQGNGGWPQLIPGVEINSVADRSLDRHGLGRSGDEVHVLGFGLDPDDPTVTAALRAQRDSRASRFRETVALLRTLEVSVDDWLDPYDADAASLGRPHIGRAMVRAGFVASLDEAFERWLRYGRPAFVPRHGLGPRAAIEVITAAGGLAVLAHSPAAAELPSAVAQLRDWGLGGLEVHYRSFPPEVVRRLARFAAGEGLLATGGSDYHGDTMSYPAAQATTFVPDAVGERQLEALARTRAGRAIR